MSGKAINYILSILMVTAAVAATALTPKIYMSASSEAVDLQSLVPEQFGDWREVKHVAGQIVNPQLQEKLDTIYSQTLSRTYVNREGRLVMLSIAYGRDQRSNMAVHYPEACYPAQGFTLKSNQTVQININGEPYTVKRIETQLGKQRHEPVTYWTTIGNHRSLGGFKKRLLELQYGFAGMIPDGLIFRVSTIGQDTQQQFAIQENFVSSLIGAIDPDKRQFLTGGPEI